MNERIQKLAEVADQLAEDELVHLERVHNRLYSFTESREIYNEKFAELIVRECDQYVAEQYDESEPWMQPGDLLKHFGVEE